MMALLSAFDRQGQVEVNAPTGGVVDDAENAFLVRCLAARCQAARGQAAGLAAARALATGETFDWELVSRRALDERVAPLLHSVLGTETFAPAAVRQQLEEAYLATAHRNLFLFHELEGALAALNEAGVDVLVLKGAALAETLYRNIAVRPLLDFDLLVRREQVAQALKTLDALGYRRVGIEPHTGIALRHENEIHLRKKGQIDVHLELHWSLFDSPHYQERLPMAWFWESATSASVGDHRARILCAEAQLLHLCGHLMLHHRGNELLWLHDIAELLCAYEGRIAWSTVLEKATVCDIVLPLQQIIALVVAEWGAPVPAGVLARLAALTPSAAEAQVFSWLAAEERPVLKRFWADLASMSNWSQRFSYAWRQLFPSRRYMRHRYGISHSFLLPFYYPYRWWLGLYRAIRAGNGD